MARRKGKKRPHSNSRSDSSDSDRPLSSLISHKKPKPTRSPRQSSLPEGSDVEEDELASPPPNPLHGSTSSTAQHPHPSSTSRRPTSDSSETEDDEPPTSFPTLTQSSAVHSTESSDTEEDELAPQLDPTSDLAGTGTTSGAVLSSELPTSSQTIPAEPDQKRKSPTSLPTQPSIPHSTESSDTEEDELAPQLDSIPDPRTSFDTSGAIPSSSSSQNLNQKGKAKALDPLSPESPTQTILRGKGQNRAPPSPSPTDFTFTPHPTPPHRVEKPSKQTHLAWKRWIYLTCLPPKGRVRREGGKPLLVPPNHPHVRTNDDDLQETETNPSSSKRRINRRRGVNDEPPTHTESNLINDSSTRRQPTPGPSRNNTNTKPSTFRSSSLARLLHSTNVDPRSQPTSSHNLLPPTTLLPSPPHAPPSPPSQTPTSVPTPSQRSPTPTPTPTSNPNPKPQADLLSTYTCPICFSPPTNVTLTPCGHICCGECLFTAVKTTMRRSANMMVAEPIVARCPVCRAVLGGWDGKGGGVVGLLARTVVSL
ncbi:hypothetical protein JAAARDRAFT_192520 [Jaapia argillacea MUCL 33604]|uniref:RING-type domain-containing protein n=1 Tax=Jaapia argillacea MUCL 33604 TaxID=933084 RepID=A0A067PVX2_9AGAM|nr:hypothetical protein JAAARDRAFT_192520 [Jaapia argillacea MUCL 33604]